MPHYNFHRDLILGKEAEESVMRLLRDEFGWKFEKYNSDSRYDLVFVNDKSKRKITVEVKVDFRAKYTGNVAVEFHCRGKKSGINATKARFWVYKIFLDDNKSKYIFISVAKIRKMIADKSYHRIVTGGDDRSNTKMYLFKVSLFEEPATVILR